MKRLLFVLFLGLPALALSPKDYLGRLEIGINVNWATFKKVMHAYDARIPRDFRAIGFDHVRIRARAYRDAAYLDHLERVVQNSLAAGLLPILAFSGGALNQDPTPEVAEEGVRWWRAVARRFADYPEALAFDLLIEPAKKLNDHPELLRAFYRQAIAAIRETNPTRVLFLAPTHAAHPPYLPELEPLFKTDPYLAAESHFYASGPSKRREARLWTTGGPEDQACVLRHVREIVAWRKKTGVPVWVGAWMPSNYNKGNDYSVPEQVAFATFFRCALKSAGIPSAVNADQQSYDAAKKAWREDRLPVVQAIIKPQCDRITKAPAPGSGVPSDRH